MNDLAADPIFQLNSILWMLQPLPSDTIPVERGTWPKPVLHELGYRIRAMSQRLTASHQVEAALASKLGMKGVPKPDVIASAPPGEAWLVIECKASSFGSDSSVVKQALKIIARSSDVSLVAGSPSTTQTHGAVLYTTRDSEAVALHETLELLRSELVDNDIDPAPTATLSLRIDEGTGITTEIAGGLIPGPAYDALKHAVVVLPAAGEKEVPRPLYFIPFDPSVKQSAQERAYCLRVLLARGRAAAASELGRYSDTGTVVLEADSLLSAATFNLSVYWKDHNDKKNAGRIVLRFVEDALVSMKNPPTVRSGRSDTVLEVLIVRSGQSEECANAVIEHHLPDDPEATRYRQLSFLGMQRADLSKSD